MKERSAAVEEQLYRQHAADLSNILYALFTDLQNHKDMPNGFLNFHLLPIGTLVCNQGKAGCVLQNRMKGREKQLPSRENTATWSSEMGEIIM